MPHTSNGTPSLTSLHIIQANLAHCMRANEALNIQQHITQHDISIIQEPYYYKHKVIGFPIKHKIIASPTPKTAIIIHNTDIQVFPIYISNTILVAKLKWKNNNFTIINTYAPPKEEIQITLNTIESLINIEEPTIVAGDFNSSNTIWGGTQNNSRGDVLLEFITAKDLKIINSPDSPPTFETENGKSWIDITLTTPQLSNFLTNWKVLDEINHSDHRYLSYNLFEHEKEKIKKLTKNGEYKILQRLKSDAWFIETSQEDINSVSRLKHVITHFYQKIDKMKRKFSKYVNNTHPCSNKWWTPQLEIERKKVRAHRRRYQNARGEIRQHYKEIYLKNLAIYQENLTKARNSSWKEFCGSISKNNPFTLPYKIAAEKLKTKTLLGSIQRKDGTQTSTLRETIELILTTLFPTGENKTQPPDLNEQNNDDSTNAFNNDPPFTEIEVDSVIHNLKKNVTPGPDNITTTFIQTLYTYHKQFLIKIFNAALKLGHFPEVWKNSRIILIPKKELDKNNPQPNQFRPIAINSIFGKILEKLLNDRIYFHLFTNNHLPPNQFGFTHNTSTTQALLNIKDSIAQANNEKCIIISLDVKNAFNQIRQSNINEYLKETECPNNLTNLVNDMLSNRTITYDSDQLKINIPLLKGSPQGSPLSPLLWNLTIAKLLTTTFPPNATIQAFADDIILTIRAPTRKKIEEISKSSLEIINEWSKRNEVEFNLAKSQFMIIGKQYQRRPPTIKFNNQNIKYSKDLKILGIIFDKNLSFLPHLDYVKRKVNKLTISLNKFTGKDWGMSSKQRKDIYIRATERMITYAALAWYRSHTHTQRKLQSIQRIPLIHITKAFRTTPNKLLPIIANIPPVKLTIEKEIKMFNILHGRDKFNWEGKTFSKNEIANKFDIKLIHPAEKMVILETKNVQKSINNQIFTDGSKSGKDVGAAFVHLNQFNKIINQQLFLLPPYSSNFEAEALAIIKALEYINTLPGNEQIQINSDSQSCIKGLSNPNNVNPFIQKIKTLITLTSEKHQIHITHVKGHSGLAGNELADELAKRAAKFGQITIIPITKSFIKSQLRKEVYDKWNQTWSTDPEKNALHKWIRTIHHLPDHFPTNYYLSQILTEHGRFPFYLKKFKITEESICKCGTQAHSFDHYMTTCTKTSTYRKEIQKTYPDLLRSKPEIIRNWDTAKILEKMVKHINENLTY